jgi:hypothetical protein
MIVDSDNKSYKLGDEYSKLENTWQSYKLNLKPIKDAIDLANISAVRFEFGTITAGNGPAAKLYLKDVLIRKAKKIKWL